MRTVDNLREQGETLKDVAKQQMSEFAAKNLMVCIDDIIDDYKAVADYSAEKLTKVLHPLESGSNELKTAVNEVSNSSREMKEALNEVLRLTRDLSVASVDTYNQQVKTLQENIEKLQEQEKDLKYSIEKATFKRVWETFKKYSLLLIVLVLILFGAIKYEGYHVTKEVTQTLALEYESLYKTFEKREELQASAEAWDNYYNYCLDTYVKCPIFGSCSNAIQEYTDKVFIPKFGNRPGTTIEGE